MKYIAVLSIIAAAAASQAVVITQWDFNTSLTAASTGTGTVSGVNLTAAIASVSGTGSTDAGSPNNSVNTSGYPAQNTGSGTAGLQALTSTAGYTGITVTFDSRNSATASRWFQVMYTTDGSTWTSAGLANGGVWQNTQGGTTWQNGQSFDLSAIAGVDNNANFGIRSFSIFAPGSGAYQATGTGNYGASGTTRYDMLTVNGSAVPEPASMAALGLGAAALIRRRRAR